MLYLLIVFLCLYILILNYKTEPFTILFSTALLTLTLGSVFGLLVFVFTR